MLVGQLFLHTFFPQTSANLVYSNRGIDSLWLARCVCQAVRWAGGDDWLEHIAFAIWTDEEALGDALCDGHGWLVGE